MNFTIVDIAIAFTIGYGLGAFGMWLVQRIRKEPEYIDDDIVSPSTPHFEGLDDEGDKTRIQTRPNLTIAKAPAHFEEFDSHGSLEMVERLPEAPDREDAEDTEDFDDSSLPGIELPLEDIPDPTDDALEDALGLDDTMSFMRPRQQNIED